MTTHSQYLATLHKNISQTFNLDELEQLCFDLGVDHENVPGDNKSAQIRNLLLSLARRKRLQMLVDRLRSHRPHVDWQDVPTDFELPAEMINENIRQVVQHNDYSQTVNIHGEGKTVHGNDVAITGGATIEQIGNNITLGENAEYVHGNKSVTNHNSKTYSIGEGAIVNVESTLTNVQQSIGALPQADESAQQELAQLVGQLNNLLQKVPQPHADQATKVAEATEKLIDIAAEDSPDQTVIKILGDGLKQRARELVDDLPEIVDVVTKIVTAVATITSSVPIT